LKIPQISFNKSKSLAAVFLFLALWGITFIPAQNSQAVTAQTATTDSILIQINDLLSASKYNDAIALFDTISLPDRDSANVQLLKASVLSSAGKYADARAVVGSITAKDPKNVDAFFVLAEIENAAGRTLQQQAALEQIIKIQPDNVEALITLGNLSLQSRAVRPAAAYFHQALTKEPDNASAMLGLARAFRMNKEWDDAQVLLNRAVELYPDLAEARSERARFYWGRGQQKDALADLDVAKKLAPDDYWISIDRANLLLEMNKQSDALEEFTRAISINPNEYTAYAYSAGLKDDLGDSDGAEKDYAALAKLNPTYFYGLEGLGLHQMRDEKWAEAKDSFMAAYNQASQEPLYALLAAINWMRAEDITKPRAFLAQVQAKVKQNTLEWYMLRLYYDLTVRNYVGESDMVVRLDKEQDLNLKARMLFYMAQYYEIRGNASLANKYYLMVNDMDNRNIPEWRLNNWIITDRKLKPF